MRTVAIVQARMGSTRLPGKVLADIAGHTMLERVIERLRRAESLDEIVVATSTAPADDAVAELCTDLGVPVFRGSEEDVLDRYAGAARASSADAIVRITADCPLIDPEVVDEVVARFRRERPDYASNTLERSWPRGLDTEIFARSALEAAEREASEAFERAHVTPFLYQSGGRFRLLSVVGSTDYSAHRWTVDTHEDLAMVRQIFELLGPGGDFGWPDVIAALQRRPDILDLNRHMEQKELREG
jgi:spore coat polysaccharide biosynthesis protein SpsF